jgi:hypothetical protein
VVSTVALAPDDSKHVFVALAGAADGGLFESRDAGASWQKRMHLAPGDYVAQILLAPSVPAQIYLSGLVGNPETHAFRARASELPALLLGLGGIGTGTPKIPVSKDLVGNR